MRSISAPAALSAAKMAVDLHNFPKLWESGKGLELGYLADIVLLHKVGFLNRILFHKLILRLKLVSLDFFFLVFRPLSA